MGWQLTAATLAASDPVTKCVNIFALGDDVVMGRYSARCLVTFSNEDIWNDGKDDGRGECRRSYLRGSE